jgi:hypothetical protein
VVVGVTADRVDVTDCVVVRASAPEIRGAGALLYNADDDTPVALAAGDVRADAVVGDRKLSLRTTLDADGGVDWKQVRPGNEVSYEQLYALNDRRAGEESA